MFDAVLVAGDGLKDKMRSDGNSQFQRDLLQLGQPLLATLIEGIEIRSDRFEQRPQVGRGRGGCGDALAGFVWETGSHGCGWRGLDHWRKSPFAGTGATAQPDVRRGL